MKLILRRRKLGNTSCREISAKSRQHLVVHRHDRRLYGWPQVDMVFRWGCTAEIPEHITVVNSANAIAEVNNKVAFRLRMAEAQLAPPTVTTVAAVATMNWPLVVRPIVHHQGRHTYKVANRAEFDRAAMLCTRKSGGWYASPFINKVAEYRVFVVQGRASCVAVKTPGNPQDVAWNVARGGRFDSVRFDDWPLKAVKTAIAAFNLSGLDFGGVDVMVDADNNCYVLEINSAPSLTSPYRQECMAKCFDYIVEHGKAKIGLTEAKGGWRKFIHPAISNEAILVTV